MPSTFSDSIAESRKAFIDLVRNASAAFYEVYSGTPDNEMEALFNEAIQDELLLRFNIQKHSKNARARFCGVNDLERRAYDLLANAEEKPLPYFGSFVPYIGHVGIAWTSDEVRELIARTKKEVAIAKQVAEIMQRSEGPADRRVDPKFSQ